MPSIPAPYIDLYHTFESGQLFRYHQEGDWWYVQTGDKVFKVQYKNKRLHFEGNVDKKYIKRFFRLEEDLSQLSQVYKKDKVLQKAFKEYKGLRIIRQDPWECIVSFICSSASNIPKIKQNIHHISKKHGQKHMFDNKAFYTFPALGKLNNKLVLKNAKTGYRAKYIYETNKLLTKETIQQIQQAPYEEAKQLLMQFPGIGEKVADCILLFAFDKMEAFPVDTWMQKIMIQEYLKETKTPKQIAHYARQKFKKNAGYVQQYLFYLSRNNSYSLPV